jgi:predicted heme/steroid binding protein
MILRQFTKEDLSRYDGMHGTPVFVAFRGKVYDLSGSLLWRGGRHQVLHSAGTDLTEELDQAPHYADLLEKYPIVGILSNE